LYDYDTDPLESKNQFNNPEYAEVQNKLSNMMRDFMKEQEVIEKTQ
jgi:hypothetical protein